MGERARVEIVTGTDKVTLIEIHDPSMVGTVGFDAGLMEVFCKHGVSYILKATNSNSIAHLVWDSQATQELVAELEETYQVVTIKPSAIVCAIGSNIGQPGILAKAGVQPGAKYVAFRTLEDPEQMPGQRSPILDWPYREGLRLDEAMHPLTILATGLYGKVLPNQNGAPIRLVVPWKYGFKSIKSIVSITLTDKQPETSWQMLQADEYGFYANVNPQVDHPRWSQATERRVGAGLFAGRQETQMFNGYADQVAGLYTGMDLAKHY